MRRLFILLSVFGTMISWAPAMGFFIDFENGSNMGPVVDIAGIAFRDFNGYTPLYGDSGTGLYNTYSDDLSIGWNSQNYHHNGYFWLWAGPNADARGIMIDFANDNGTWFRTGYSSTEAFVLEAWLTDGSMVDVTGDRVYEEPMQFLEVHAPDGKFIDYIVLHDQGNFWMVDDMSGDATLTMDPVPEPSILVLMALGLAATAFTKRYWLER